MNYALIENGVITNVIYLSSANAYEFPNAVNIDQYPVGIGDTYVDGKFYHDGVEVLTYTEYRDQIAQARLLEEMDEAYREGVNSV